MHHISGRSKWLVAASVFAVCIAASFISYQQYVFRWDDSGYLQMSIAVSRAFWSGNAHGIAHLREIGAAMYSFRPPAMTLLGLPWGPLAAWDAAGKCFFTLAILISFFAASCLFLLARIGMKPLLLALASICVFASFGPLPPGAAANHLATAFMADGLFAWITLAALLLIPYEARTYSLSIGRAFLRGVLWGLILSSGAMTKISFLYFVVLIVPTLLAIRSHHGGLRSALAALIGLAGSSAPAAAYLVKYGGSAFANGGGSSFGGIAKFYNVSLLQFLSDSMRHSPGLAVFSAVLAAALAYLGIKKRASVLGPESVAVLIISGFGIIFLASVNRQLRYSFPVILALPFLLGVLLSAKQSSVPRRSAALVSGLVFCCLAVAALPTRHRAERQASLGRSDAILAQASQCNDKHILLATDSPTLNEPLMKIAIAVSRSTTPTEFDALAYRAINGSPIDDDFHAMQQSDLIVFQDDDALSPPFTNSRVSDYRQYISQRGGYVPIRLWGDVIVYSKHCKP